MRLLTRSASEGERFIDVIRGKVFWSTRPRWRFELVIFSPPTLRRWFIGFRTTCKSSAKTPSAKANRPPGQARWGKNHSLFGFVCSIFFGLLSQMGSTTLAAEAAPLEPSTLVTPQSLSSSLPWLIGATVLSLVPAVLLMSTCFVRFAVVLGLLRQALGTPQVLPNQVMMAMSLFLTFTVMAPVWSESYETGWKPYSTSAVNSSATLEAALPKMLAPIRRFMSRQIDTSGNADGVWMLLDLQRQHAGETDRPEPKSYDEVPITVLLPAFLLSELKTGFLIGFQLFLPFLVIDFVIASVLTALGLTTLTPTSVALPFKLLLFVLIDGWFLTVGMLLASVH